MFDDPERYENDGLFDEDTDYEDIEYEADNSDYIVDDEDEEDENALWDDADEDAADKDDADEPPEKKRRKRKKKVLFTDSDTDAVNGCIDYHIKLFIISLRHKTCCILIRDQFNKFTKVFFIFTFTDLIKYNSK